MRAKTTHKPLAVLAAIALAAAAACAPPPVVSQDGTYVDPNSPPGGTNLPPGTSASAQSYFETNVQQAVENECASCHAVGTGISDANFLPANSADYYTALANDPTMVTNPASNSLLVIYGSAAAAHFGTFDAAEMQAIQAWLELEFRTAQPPPPPNTSNINPNVDREALFASNVSVHIQARCAICHESGTAVGRPVLFGGAGGADDYAAVVANIPLNGNFQPAQARLINKGVHDGGAAPAFSTSEVAEISEWLLTEYAARNGGTPAPSTGTVDLLAQFVGCMNLDDWSLEININGNNYGMEDWGDRNADGDYECHSCHSDGEYFFFAHDDTIIMYNGNRTSYFASSFFTIGSDPATGQAMVVPAFDKLDRKCNGENLHPPCRGDDAAYNQRLQIFYDDTMARMAAGTCGPPGYIDQ